MAMVLASEGCVLSRWIQGGRWIDMARLGRRMLAQRQNFAKADERRRSAD